MEFALVDGENFSPSCPTLVMVRIRNFSLNLALVARSGV
jgi:hypothetical protein